MTLIEIFSEFICKKDMDFSQKALELSKNSIFDCIGAMIMGSNSKVIDKLQKNINTLGDATILGKGKKYFLEEAAFVNGISGHEFELDDTSSSNLGHPTVAVLPALLAIAEKEKKSGMELIKSFLIATEIECKIGRICAKELHKKGWHASTITGIIGAAAGGAYLLNLNKEETENCLGIAASMASGVRQNFGTETKSVQIGLVSKNAIIASSLAKNGITASKEALDGKEGYLYEYAGKHYDSSEFPTVNSLGHEFDICSPGFTLKRYPSCSSTHRAVDGFVDIYTQNKFSIDDIKKIKIGLGEAALRELVTPNPKTGEEAKFSIGFQIGLMMLEIPNLPEAYTEENIYNKEVQKIINRTELYHEERSDNLPSEMGVGPAYVEVELNNGQKFLTIKKFPKGHLTEPFSKEELIAKFKKCTENIISEENIEKLCQLLYNLENEESIEKILELTY